MSLALIPRSVLPRSRSLYRGWPGRFASGREVDRLFGDLFGLAAPASPLPAEKARGFVPKLDITESDEGYMVSAELPGVKQEDLEVVFEDNVLTLKGEKKSGAETAENGVRRSETRFGSFERRVAFQGPIAQDEVTARYADGLLTIALPKPPEARPKVRTVPIETS